MSAKCKFGAKNLKIQVKKKVQEKLQCNFLFKSVALFQEIPMNNRKVGLEHENQSQKKTPGEKHTNTFT